MKFLLTGDSLFSSSNLSETIDPALLSILNNADEVFTNAEFVTPRTSTSPAAGRGYQTSVRPPALDEFPKLNIRYVSFANNHTGDYGIEGMIDTIEEAESRGIYPLGVGRTLYDAKKPVFINTKDGRIALITVDITRSEVFAAADPGNGISGRPGVNPLRWSRRYVVNDEDFQAIKDIAKRIGIDQSMAVGKKIETFKPGPDTLYDFGSLFEGYITFENGENPGVRTIANAQDRERILKTIEDAKHRSDYVFVGFHSHEGENENWYSDFPAGFVEEFAHAAIEHGASCVFGHGAHFTRGIELYQERPIFYNIGSLFMEFEAGESIISPEMFAAYGYAVDEAPSTLHRNRAKDADGNWLGFNSDPKFSENFLVMFDLNRDQNLFDFELIPIDLHLTSDYVTKRGLPSLASSEQTDHLVSRLNTISKERYQTEICDQNGHLKCRSVN